jgi:DNA-binding GntR family transcriptional regulator
MRNCIPSKGCAAPGARMDFLRAYEELESAILTGELKPRERLVESELAARLGVSRTPVREALRRLEERGLVRILPHRGAVVSDISPGEVENIYAVRIYLESLACRLACLRTGPAGIRQVEEMGAEYEAEAARREIRSLMRANDRFHDAIYITAENPCLFELIQQLRRQVHAVRFHAWAQSERIARSLAEHQEMVEALRLRDAVRLTGLTRDHLRVAKESYLTHLGKPPEPAGRAESAVAAGDQASARGT